MTIDEAAVPRPLNRLLRSLPQGGVGYNFYSEASPVPVPISPEAYNNHAAPPTARILTTNAT
jgi:hypothetical protein